VRPHAAGFLREEGHCQVVREEGNAGVSRWNVWLTPIHAAASQQVFPFLTILERIFLEKMPVKNGKNIFCESGENSCRKCTHDFLEKIIALFGRCMIVAFRIDLRLQSPKI
jgi:hypothetical protein